MSKSKILQEKMLITIDTTLAIVACQEFRKSKTLDISIILLVCCFD